MKRVANIFMYLGLILGGITIMCIAAYGILEYFGFLFVDKINVIKSMSNILNILYICFGGTILAFIIYHQLAKNIN